MEKSRGISILFFYSEINRGVMKMPAIGGYTGKERPMLMVIVYQTEFTKLKHIIKTVDLSAFVIVQTHMKY